MQLVISHCRAKFWFDRFYCWKCWQWAGRMQLQCSRPTAPSQEYCVQLKMPSVTSAARTARLNTTKRSAAANKRPYSPGTPRHPRPVSWPLCSTPLGRAGRNRHTATLLLSVTVQQSTAPHYTISVHAYVSLYQMQNQFVIKMEDK
jgi:hypothetical protein